MEKAIIKYYKELLEYVEQCNTFHVFNYYDSEYVETIKNHIEQMSKKEDFDRIPIAACKYCNSPHIIVDEENNDVCMKCGSVNEIKIYNTIYDLPGHLEFKK